MLYWDNCFARRLALKMMRLYLSWDQSHQFGISLPPFYHHRAFNNVTSYEGSQFLKLYYSGRGSWNEETQTSLYPGDATTPVVQILSEDAYKVTDYYELAKKSVFSMPSLDQFDPATCTAHAAKCCWPRDRQANDNNGNCATEYDTNCVDKDVGKWWISIFLLPREEYNASS